MKKCILFLFVIILVCCKGNVEETYFTPEKALAYLAKIENIANRDSGKLWGENLYGPVMFIDRPSRKITTNQPDHDNILNYRDGVYTGYFPKELVINNAPVYYGNTFFAMVPLPPEEDEYRIITRSFHGLFHRFQHKKWDIHVTTFNTPHLDEKQSRMWLKLEWKALKKAIENEGDEKLQAIRDALIFRDSYRQSYRQYEEDQNRFENYEGLTTFTYILLVTESDEEFRSRLFEYLDRIYLYQSYSRSYGFIHGALYATLLHQNGFDFRTLKSEKTDLGKLVKEIYEITLPESSRDVAGSIALNYNINEIYREEEERLENIRESLNKQMAIFTEKPQMYFELESPYFDFEPEDVHSLDSLGTLYNRLRVSDNWGKLSVDKIGCLVSNNYKYLRINAKGFKKDRNHIRGEGWNLVLNANWEITEVDENFFVRKLTP